MSAPNDKPTEGVEEVDASSKYAAPAKKSVEEILNLDCEDESLKKYKETLLGGADSAAFPNNPKHVIVQKLSLIVEGRQDMCLDLTDDTKGKSFVLKEGCSYKIRIHFYVQHQIVSGLKYVQKTVRNGVQVDKTKFMVGSYGPKMEMQSYTTPVEEAPSGMLSRASYTIKSLFTDDDEFEHLAWKWTLDIKKGWE